MAFEDLDGELEGCTLEELQEIHDTQQDLYSAEEIEHIASLIAARRDVLDAERKRLEAMVEERLPEEIECRKCGGPNEFTNVKCKFCGATLDKSEYYDDARAVLYGGFAMASIPTTACAMRLSPVSSPKRRRRSTMTRSRGSISQPPLKERRATRFITSSAW